MSAIIDFVLSVPGLIAALCIGAAWLWQRPASRVARRFIVSAAVCYLLASIYAVPATINSLLAYGYRQFAARDVPTGATAVVVLSGGYQAVTGWGNQWTSVMSPPSAARVLETWRVFQLLSPAWIISSGGLVGHREPAEPSSVQMRDALLKLGVPPGRVVLESASGDTHDEAEQVAKVLRTMHVDHVILVTSDTHMRRSVGAFRAQGVRVIPAVAPDPRRFLRWSFWLTPTSGGLSFSGEIAHELAGIPYYWLRGWWKAPWP